MGLPFFCWKPQIPLPQRTHVDLGEELSDLQVTPVRVASDAVTLNGRYTRLTHTPQLQVRIVLERFKDRHLFRKLSAMINHLERGGYVTFGLDSAKAYGAKIKTEHTQNRTTIDVSSNLYKRYHPDSSSLDMLAASTTAPYGDEIVIESPPPIAAREYFTVVGATDAGSGGARYKIDTSSTITGDMLRFDYPVDSFVRFSDFYPRLFLPESQVGGGLLTHDHRNTYTLDLPLTYIIPQPVKAEAEPAQPAESDTSTGSTENAPRDNDDDQSGTGGGAWDGWTVVEKYDDDGVVYGGGGATDWKDGEEPELPDDIDADKEFD
tara:strand:+ start:773 stop:1735 length:963 start_codon:yes stop_codon:yes gene_type:complete